MKPSLVLETAVAIVAASLLVTGCFVWHGHASNAQQITVHVLEGLDKDNQDIRYVQPSFRVQPMHTLQHIPVYAHYYVQCALHHPANMPGTAPSNSGDWPVRLQTIGCPRGGVLGQHLDTECGWHSHCYLALPLSR